MQFINKFMRKGLAESEAESVSTPVGSGGTGKLFTLEKQNFPPCKSLEGKKEGFQELCAGTLLLKYCGVGEGGICASMYIPTHIPGGNVCI